MEVNGSRCSYFFERFVVVIVGEKLQFLRNVPEKIEETEKNRIQFHVSQFGTVDHYLTSKRGNPSKHGGSNLV